MADDPKKKGEAEKKENYDLLIPGKFFSGSPKLVLTPEDSDRLSHLFFNANVPTGNSSLSNVLVSTVPASANTFTFPTFDDKQLSQYRELQSQILKLRQDIEDGTRALRKEKTTVVEKEARIHALEKTLKDLKAKENLGFLLNRVHPDAQPILLESEDFQKAFLETKECLAFVMSVDIRRSTELMLKARSPDEFSRFITTLCADLINIIVSSFGVFDKFTGDGVLAFFPEFYSGKDSAYRTLLAADRCHEVFRRHYHNFRRSFNSVLIDVGLGIGIDYGQVRLVQMTGGLTVVGVPVVYACRLSGAPAGLTYLNQPAYEQLSDRFGAHCFTKETELEIKHEGAMLAYEASLNRERYEPIPPDWQQK